MKSGFVMLAGRSNVGKSTLLNTLIGTKVAIVTPKPQTTRHPIRGILHDKRGQIVFVDTPGVFLGRKDRVSKVLNEFVDDTLSGVDAVVYVMDPTRDMGPEEEHIQKMLRATRVPVIAVINKADLDLAKRPHQKTYEAADVNQVTTLNISAQSHKNLNLLVDALFDVLQENEPHYPDLQLTDISHNQWLEELVREKIFLNLEEEIPYSIKVQLEELEIREDGSRFLAMNIWTTEERYKKMIIGKGAEMLKRIGMAARHEIEDVVGCKVFLELNVKVDPKWQTRFV
ncbi:MAG: GTPase Era [Patescibacteria group bacterium]|nr:GTPase Era [Patescibacteria group bacterium]